MATEKIENPNEYELTRSRFWKDLKQFVKDQVCISAVHRREDSIIWSMRL